MAFGNYLSFCLLGILTYTFGGTDGYEAIIGGEIINDQSFRYQVSLYINDKAKCGGGIISNYHVLTAARCAIDNNGDWYYGHMAVSLLNKKSRNLVLDVDEILLPRQYKVEEHQTVADFSVLRLARPLKTTYPQGFARLELSSNNRDHAGEKVWIIGFASMKLLGRPLLIAEAEVISHKKCQEAYRNHKLQRKIDHTHICAQLKKHGNRYRGVCHDDEGSPLVRDGIVIGILSLIAPRCDETHLPAIYTRVSFYRHYILNYMRGIGGVVKLPQKSNENLPLKSDPLNQVSRSQILLRVEEKHYCGGGILDVRHVLTAARCVIDHDGRKLNNNMTIRAGSQIMHEGILFEIEEIRVPREYRPQENHTIADIAVLKLTQPMKSTNFRVFTTFSLPMGGYDYAFQSAWVACFGSTRDQTRPVSFAVAHILSRTQCQEAYGNHKNPRSIHNDQICAWTNQMTDASRGIRINDERDDDHHVCSGDVGNPLFLDDGTVIGVLSLITPDADETNIPSIYTRVSSYRQHIVNYTRGIGGVVHNQMNRGDWVHDWLNY